MLADLGVADDENAKKIEKRDHAISMNEICRRIVRHLEHQLLPRRGSEVVHFAAYKLFRRLIEKQLKGDSHCLLESILPTAWHIAEKATDVQPLAGTAKRKAAVLGILNSTIGILFIICVVIVSFILGGGGGVDTGSLEQSTLDAINVAFSAFFLLEVIFRSWAMGLSAYLREPICLVDLVCTIVDSNSNTK